MAVYYTRTQPGKAPRLVREFHQVPAGTESAAKVRAAVTEMLTGRPLDPDYADLWPDGARVLNVTVDSGVATVDLGGAAAANLGVEASAIAWQQLVWTVTAVPDIKALKLMLDSKAAGELWGHLDVGGPQRRAPAADVLHSVWLISPQQGERVGREVTVHIAAIAFEATVNYEIKRAGVVVKEGFVTLNEGAPAQGETKQTVELDLPGEYVIAAFLISAEDNSRQSIDDHQVTVA